MVTAIKVSECVHVHNIVTMFIYQCKTIHLTNCYVISSCVLFLIPVMVQSIQLKEKELVNQ